MQSGHLFVFESELFAATGSYSENRLERVNTAIQCNLALRDIMRSQMAAFQAIYDKFNQTYLPSTALTVEMPSLDAMGDVYFFNSTWNTHSTSLFIASQYGYSDVVQALCDARADPNLKDKINRSPLVVALRECRGYDKDRYTRCVKTLLEAKASPHTDSPLFEARNVESTQLLLDAKADPNEFSKCFQTTPLLHFLKQPLYWHPKKSEEVRMLLEAKADPNKENRIGEEPFAAAIDDEVCTRHLLEAHADPHLIPRENINALFRKAVFNNNMIGVMSILFTDINLNELDRDNQPIVDAMLNHVNPSSNHLSLLTFLVNHGAIVSDNPKLTTFLAKQNQYDKNISLFLSELKPRVPQFSEAYDYIEKLEILQLALLKIHVIQMMALWPTSTPFAYPLIQLILEYDDPIPFIPKSPIRFFDAKSVNPALLKLKTEVNQLKTKAPDGFFETVLNRLNNNLDSKAVSTRNRCSIM